MHSPTHFSADATISTVIMGIFTIKVHDILRIYAMTTLPCFFTRVPDSGKDNFVRPFLSVSNFQFKQKPIKFTSQNKK